MDPDFRATVEPTLVSLRHFLSSCPPGLQGVRVVRYSGGGLLGALDVALPELEGKVSDAVREGCSVAWVWRNALLYLQVVQAGGPAPSWERVFAEQDLADVRSVLGQAGT